jgi:DNA-binding transcriptional ArsR family regulator
MRRDVFQAIADPTRRAIINLVAHQSLNLNSVAENFDISRPAVSKHIKILTECGLIVIRQDGRDHYCEAKLDKLNEISEWVEQYKKFWNQKFDALENYLQKIQAKDKPMPTNTSASKHKSKLTTVGKIKKKSTPPKADSVGKAKRKKNGTTKRI